MVGPFACYASELGGCSGKASREHYLSRSVLKLIGTAPIIEGVPGIPDGNPIGIDALATKILCDTHNTALSPLDAEAARMFGAIQRFDADLRDASTPTSDTESVSGYKIERWMLKVMLGLAAANDRAGRPQAIREQRRMLGLLFGKGNWPRLWGFYVGAKLGDTMAAPADLAVTTGVHPETGEQMAMTVWIRFLPLLLALGVPNLPRASLRPATLILDRPPESATKTVQLSWGDGKPHTFLRFSRTGSMDGWATLP